MMNKTALATGERTILNQCSMGETVTVFFQGRVINGACEHMWVEGCGECRNVATFTSYANWCCWPRAVVGSVAGDCVCCLASGCLVPGTQR